MNFKTFSHSFSFRQWIFALKKENEICDDHRSCGDGRLRGNPGTDSFAKIINWVNFYCSTHIQTAHGQDTKVDPYKNCEAPTPITEVECPPPSEIVSYKDENNCDQNICCPGQTCDCGIGSVAVPASAAAIAIPFAIAYPCPIWDCLCYFPDQTSWKKYCINMRNCSLLRINEICNVK